MRISIQHFLYRTVLSLGLWAVCTSIPYLGYAQTVSGINQDRQRVGELITLSGSDLCDPGNCVPGTITFVEVGRDKKEDCH